VALPNRRFAEIAADALRLIAGDRCWTFTRGRCSDEGSGRVRGARYGAEKWCDSCVATDALVRMESGGMPEPTWQAILKAERDEAVDRADRTEAVCRHAVESWERLRVAAENVLAVPGPVVPQ
jgi:hypothetical protein